MPTSPPVPPAPQDAYRGPDPVVIGVLIACALGLSAVWLTYLR